MTSLKSRYTDGARRGFFKLGIVLARLGMTADALTVLGFVLHVAAVPLIVSGHFVTAALIFIVAALCDALDGAVARAGTGATRAGAFLDSTLDRASELVVSGALAFYFAREAQWPQLAATLIALGAAFLVSYTRARAEALGTDCRVGWMSRPERIVVLCVGFLFAGRSVAGVSVLTICVWLLAILTTVTVLHRMAHVLRKLRLAEEGSTREG